MPWWALYRDPTRGGDGTIVSGTSIQITAPAELQRIADLRIAIKAVSKHARPGAFARLTNNVIYERLAPGLLEELQTRNPSDGHGHRKHKHFQYLSVDYGDPRLKAHLDRVVFRMSACSSWHEFERLIDRALTYLATHPSGSPLLTPATAIGTP